MVLNKHIADGGQPVCDRVTIREFPLSRKATTHTLVFVELAIVVPVGIVNTEKSNGVLVTLIKTLPLEKSPSKSVAVKEAL